MAEPSSGLRNPLLVHHLHLQVDHRYPFTPNNLSTEYAVRELSQAPRIVQDRTVKWQYLTSPPDGTLFLAWQATNQLGTTYPSDGLIWSSPEKGPHDLHPGGFHLQVFVAEAGFTPGNESLCCHRRVRYRLLSSPNGGHDPQLELVHYMQSWPEHQMSSQRVPLTQQTDRVLRERTHLQTLGRLDEKAFMLHDRDHYPVINLPGNQIPGNPYAQTAQMYGRGGMGRGQPQPGAMRPGMGPSPHRRSQPGAMRPGGPMQNPFAASQQIPEFLKDEDNHVYGDALDFLTPREMAVARYKQHHEWMEEILMSPYSTKNILPVNLGLRLTGELGQLTDGLYHDRPVSQGSESQKAAVDGGLNIEAIPDFEKRVHEYVKKSEEEIAEMKRVQKAKMEEMTQQKVYADLERRLTGQPTNETLDEILREAEAASHAKIVPRDTVVQIAKGGVLDQVEEQHNKDQGGDEYMGFDDMNNTAGEALDAFDYGMDYSTG